jgi:hypothetical protein
MIVGENQGQPWVNVPRSPLLAHHNFCFSYDTSQNVQLLVPFTSQMFNCWYHLRAKCSVVGTIYGPNVQLLVPFTSQNMNLLILFKVRLAMRRDLQMTTWPVNFILPKTTHRPHLLYFSVRIHQPSISEIKKQIFLPTFHVAFFNIHFPLFEKGTVITHHFPFDSDQFIPNFQ